MPEVEHFVLVAHPLLYEAADPQVVARGLRRGRGGGGRARRGGRAGCV
jgi:hypothetical protein